MAFYNVTFTIANGATTSDAINLTKGTLVALEIPSTFDGTTLTFTAAEWTGSGGIAGTYYPIYDASGNQVTVTTAASRRVNFSPTDFLGIKSMKLVAGTSQSTTSTLIVGVLATV